MSTVRTPSNLVASMLCAAVAMVVVVVMTTTTTTTTTATATTMMATMLMMTASISTVGGFGFPLLIRPNTNGTKNPKVLLNIDNRNVGGDDQRPIQAKKEKMKDGTTATPTTADTSNFTYRKAKVDDVPSIARLVFESFDDNDDGDDHDDDDGSVQKDSEKEDVQNQHLKELEQIFSDRIQSERFRGNAMIIAVAKTYPDDNCQNLNDGAVNTDIVAGFMELGSMPSPISTEINNRRRRRSQPSSLLTTTAATAAAAAATERPYIANLCVDPSFRRYGIGTRLVKLALKIASSASAMTSTSTKTNNSKSDGSNNNNSSNENDDYLFLSVENDNIQALKFYDTLGFVDMGIPYNTTNTNTRMKSKLETSTLQRERTDVEDSRSEITSIPMADEGSFDDSNAGVEKGKQVYNWGAGIVDQDDITESKSNEGTNIPSTTTNTKIYLRKNLA